jgi:hypothetical protein
VPPSIKNDAKSVSSTIKICRRSEGKVICLGPQEIANDAAADWRGGVQFVYVTFYVRESYRNSRNAARKLQGWRLGAGMAPQTFNWVKKLFRTFIMRQGGSKCEAVTWATWTMSAPLHHVSPWLQKSDFAVFAVFFGIRGLQFPD